MSSDERLERMESKIDSISARMNGIDRTLVRQAMSLEEHMRRTDILEKKLVPVEKHVTMVDRVIKFLGILALLATIVELFKKVKRMEQSARSFSYAVLHSYV